MKYGVAVIPVSYLMLAGAAVADVLCSVRSLREESNDVIPVTALMGLADYCCCELSNLENPRRCEARTVSLPSRRGQVHRSLV